MKFPHSFLVICAILGCLRSPRCEAQDKPVSQKVYVAFRMSDWKSQHINDAAAAKKHIATLKTLGCEVKTAEHNGHTDVSCRTELWKALALDSHDQAHQWIDWLKKSGFETLHGHKPGTHPHEHKAGEAHHEVVQYRLPEWNSRHIHEKRQLVELTALYQGLGCEMESSSHSGHTDLKARCSDWMEIELDSHEVAHTWQKFLGGLGFETKHEH